jgi:hypothetical protein
MITSKFQPLHPEDGGKYTASQPEDHDLNLHCGENLKNLFIIIIAVNALENSAYQSFLS